MPALLANAAGLPDHAVYKVAPIHLGLLERTDGQARRPRNRQTHQQRREHDEMKWMRNVGVMAAVVLVVACTSMPKALPVDTDASRSGAVGVSEITDAMLAVPRMELSKDETFFLPRGDDANALPTYPASLLARRLPPPDRVPAHQRR